MFPQWLNALIATGMLLGAIAGIVVAGLILSSLFIRRQARASAARVAYIRQRIGG